MNCGAYDLTFGQEDPGIGVTLCRESAEPRRDTGDDDSLVIVNSPQSVVAVSLSRRVSAQ